jgi:hypothetical protein
VPGHGEKIYTRARVDGAVRTVDQLACHKLGELLVQMSGRTQVAGGQVVGREG